MSIDVALLVLRILVGALLMGHGCQKLFGWFGGYGLKGTEMGFRSMGFRPALLSALLAGIGEAGGGLLLLLGLLNPIGPLAVIACMLVAIIRVHWANGLWAPGGIELPLVYLATSAVTGLAGTGVYSADAYLGLTLPVSLVFWVGVVGVIIVDGVLIAAARRPASAVPATEPASA